MSLEVEATYENGVLKLDAPLPLREHEPATVSIKPRIDRVTESYGCVPAPIDPNALEYLTNSPENGPWEGE